ncbi:MAG TPA: MauE/DoxX family redox-associated membrane protein, partial [Acidimicrobiales bacterium]|nr:MauE/DoxX family redox-associated membrane protein [Acidimicrobiales bacterium]
AAGLAKTLRPDDTARALSALTGRRPGLRLVRGVVRLLAALEVAVGVAGFLRPGGVGLLVAGSYAAFTGVVLYARRRGGPLATCGCFGRADTPATRTHAVLTGGLAAFAVGASQTGPADLAQLVARQPLDGVPMLLAAAGIAVVAWMAMTLLATLRGAP